MKKNREYLKFLFLGICCLIITLLIPVSSVLKLTSEISDLSAWYTYYLSKESVKPLKLIAIAVDADSLSKVPQRWPWRRSIHGRLLKLLDNEGVNTVGVDFIFLGDSENKEDDLLLAEKIKNLSCRVILASLFDPRQGPVLPPQALLDSAYLTGIVNTPQDPDQRTRRIRGYIEYRGEYFYSFPVALAAAYLDRGAHKIISSLPLLKNRTFHINYILKERDILNLSYIEVLENLNKLKQRYGNNFFKDSLVVIYPQAAIFHDEYLTPLGTIPGGIVHLNAVANIILGKFSQEFLTLNWFFFLLSLFLLSCLLKDFEFIPAFLLSAGLLMLIFWFHVFLILQGISFGLAKTAFFIILFFSVASLYKYLHFLIQLIGIKNKVTLDPLRGLFTLRYFYYRLELEMKKIFFQKSLYLIFISMEGFKNSSEGMPLDNLKKLWQRICLGLSFSGKKGFWSVYSAQEVVGCVVSTAKGSENLTQSLKRSLEAMFNESGIKCKVSVGYAKLKKNYPLNELVFFLAAESKEKDAGTVFLDDCKLREKFSPLYHRTGERSAFMVSLDEDIEDKNSELLSLIERLNKEYVKSKELYFQIIISLVNALDARDPYTQGHSERVCKYVLLAADRLDWTEEHKEKLRKAALLHDIGKIGITDTILHKKGRLNDEEWDFIKKHELIGVKILEPIKELADILPWIMYHHEKWDGTGYPHGLAGESIPREAQLIALADSYDAMTTGRDYKAALGVQEALDEIIRCKGKQFSSRLADVFVEVISQNQK